MFPVPLAHFFAKMGRGAPGGRHNGMWGMETFPGMVAVSWSIGETARRARVREGQTPAAYGKIRSGRVWMA